VGVNLKNIAVEPQAATAAHRNAVEPQAAMPLEHSGSAATIRGGAA